jgi:flagellar protein FliO/FliZ
VIDIPALLKLPLALALVIGLIFLVAYLVRRFGPFAGALPSRRAAKRLGMVASQVIDNKRRLVLIRRDGVEHLLLLGGSQDLVIEHGITPPEDEDQDALPGDPSLSDPAAYPSLGSKTKADPAAPPGQRTEPTL